MRPLNVQELLLSRLPTHWMILMPYHNFNSNSYVSTTVLRLGDLWQCKYFEDCSPDLIRKNGGVLSMFMQVLLDFVFFLSFFSFILNIERKRRNLGTEQGLSTRHICYRQRGRILLRLWRIVSRTLFVSCDHISEWKKTLFPGSLFLSW